jgi:hypothetical protein
MKSELTGSGRVLSATLYSYIVSNPSPFLSAYAKLLVNFLLSSLSERTFLIS